MNMLVTFIEKMRYLRVIETHSKENTNIFTYICVKVAMKLTTQFDSIERTFALIHYKEINKKMYTIFTF